MGSIVYHNLQVHHYVLILVRVEHVEEITNVTNLTPLENDIHVCDSIVQIY